MTKEIPLGSGLYAIVDDEDVSLVSQYNWRPKLSVHTYYARRSIGKHRSQYMHQLITGWTECDHINGVGWDNRRRAGHAPVERRLLGRRSGSPAHPPRYEGERGGCAPDSGRLPRGRNTPVALAAACRGRRQTTVAGRRPHPCPPGAPVLAATAAGAPGIHGGGVP